MTFTIKSSNSTQAMNNNMFMHRYVIAFDHAFLWVAALSLAGFAHVSTWFDHKEALLISTLVAYCAYLCESGLGTWRVATSNTQSLINFRKAALWKWVWLNVAVNAILAVFFLLNPSWWWIIAVIFTAGWQKYMDGRIPPRLQATMVPVKGQTFKSKIL